jgi:hypothetical protein
LTIVIYNLKLNLCFISVGHPSHSAYIFCGLCTYTGSVCGCKSQPDEEPPADYDNNIGSMDDNSTRGRALKCGVLRKKRKGEHIVFLDVLPVMSDRYRHEILQRVSQKHLLDRLTSAEFTQADVAAFAKRRTVSGFSPMTAFPPSIFRLTRDYGLDG